MKIDCSKAANRDDAVVGLTSLVMIAMILGIIYLITVNSFLAGFLAAVLVFKLQDWVSAPIARLIDTAWPEDHYKHKGN